MGLELRAASLRLGPEGNWILDRTRLLLGFGLVFKAAQRLATVKGFPLSVTDASFAYNVTDWGLSVLVSAGNPVPYLTGRPVGTSDNSPPLQRWVKP